MKPAEARTLGDALAAAGILVGVEITPHGRRGEYSKIHGTAAVGGTWAGRDAHALIACPDVARAVLAAGGRTDAALRACAHGHHHLTPASLAACGACSAARLRAVGSAAAPAPRKRARRCPCPSHRGGVCADATRAA